MRKYILTGLIILTLILTGCETTQILIPTGELADRTSISVGQELATQEMKKFDNIEELRVFLQQRTTTTTSRSYGATKGLMVETISMDMAAEGAPAPSAQAEDYSTTNIQVKGVDEADIVKNDGRYIYLITDNKLLIVDAYDAENAEIISTTKFEKEDEDYYNRQTPKELFIKDNKLVLFVEAREKAFYFQKYDIVPRDTYRPKLYIYIYDISDKSDPEMLEEFSITGSYFQSRMIDGIVYVVSQENVMDGVYINEPIVRILPEPPGSPENPIKPEGVIKAKTTVIKPEIYYFDNPEENYQFNTITSIDVSDEEVVDSKTLMLGYSNTLMVSENNIYIAYQKQKYWRFWYHREEYEKERFYDVILPLLEGDLRSDIRKVTNKNLNEQEEWREVSRVLSEFYAKLEDDEELQDEYEDMFEEISDALEEYDNKKALEERETVIHKININNGNLEYQAKGEVYGSLLNQFSLDEYKGNLRLATTVEIWNKKRIQHNNVYVLDENMKKIGEVTGIAEDEKIYSTRFIGNRLYMVTFKRIDPFFVIDLSNPRDPEILGKLKIPGYSDYLHPYDENHIIGVGKETGENEWGGVTTKGVKIALFDVSDVSDPKEIDKYEIGERGSDSPALHDHHAFLFSKERNLLVLPVTEITRREKLSEYRYSNSIWNGAYVFHVDEDGFEVIGKVKHSSSKSDYFNWRTEASVLRSLYMDDNLYTISNKYIKINDLSDELEELNSIKLPYREGYRNW